MNIPEECCGHTYHKHDHEFDYTPRLAPDGSKASFIRQWMHDRTEDEIQGAEDRFRRYVDIVQRIYESTLTPEELEMLELVRRKRPPGQTSNFWD